MMRWLFFVILVGATKWCGAQELFPNTEPASTVPKGVFGVRLLTETYNESGAFRNQFSARLMYGVTKNLTLWAQPMLSNHHGESFPSDLFNHSHSSGISFTRPITYGRKYKYTFAGIHLYAKYRLLNFDQDDQHLRVALYGEYSPFSNQAHDEAEAHLQGDTGGVGAGAIVTYLKSRLAFSFTGGYIVPKKFTDLKSNNRYEFTYSNAINYSLSIGYLLYPKTYKSYNQPNYNLYLEFIGKAFDDAAIMWFDVPVEVRSPALMAHRYLDAYLGIQRIVNSNNRLEVSIGLPFLSKSYRHFYPILNIGWQRYLYGKK